MTTESSFDAEAGDVRGETVNIQNAGVRDVYAESVVLTMGSAGAVHADTVTVKQAGVRTLEGQQVSLKQGGVFQLTGEQVEVIASGVGIIQAAEVRVGPSCNSALTLTEKVTMEQSVAPVMIARHDAHLEQSAVVALVANRVTLHHSAVGLAVAETIEGDVRVQAKPAVAAIFGAAFGAAFGVVMLIGRRRK